MRILGMQITGLGKKLWLEINPPPILKHGTCTLGNYLLGVPGTEDNVHHGLEGGLQQDGLVLAEQRGRYQLLHLGRVNRQIYTVFNRVRWVGRYGTIHTYQKISKFLASD